MRVVSKEQLKIKSREELGISRIFSVHLAIFLSKEESTKN